MSSSSIADAFFALLRFSLDSAFPVPNVNLAPQAWQVLYAEARRQTVSGLLWRGVERLPADMRPPRVLLLTWYAEADHIRRTNARINAEAVALQSRLAADGIRSTVLKGQGLSLLYPDAGLRTPGDIDIWLQGSRRRILAYVRSHVQCGEVRYHHVGYRISGNSIAVEIHFTPSWMNVPWRNVCLQRWFCQEELTQMGHSLPLADGSACRLTVPTPAFNAVYVLIHIFRHLLGEGVGLRQVVDYAQVLRHMPAADRPGVVKTLSRLGLERFAAGLAYVMCELGLSADDCLVPSDDVMGRFLLNEIMQSGNFGKNDARLVRRDHETPFYRFCRSLRRNVRFVRFFPAETLFDPFFKLWHYAWQHLYGYRKVWGTTKQNFQK